MASNRKATSRKTIGLFTSRIGRAWGLEFMTGITDAAEAYDVNLVCFVGGKPNALFTPGELKPSYGLYDLARPDQLDGLVLAADIAHNVRPADLERFRENFADIPTVAHAIELDGIPNLNVDNIGGMRAIIRHLIEDHGYRRIAFIRGLKDQVEAEQRFFAYKEELKAHHIKFDERLVAQGDFSPESGRAAARSLLDSLEGRLDAIVAANDRMAFGAMEALQLRGIKVPSDIAVTGFDDVREAQALGVPLTTVRQSFYDVGYRSLETLLAYLESNTPPQPIILPTQPVIRWSCGCLPESIHKAIVEQKEVAQTGRLENKRDAAIRAMMQAGNVTEQSPLAEKFKQAAGDAWNTFLQTLSGASARETFLTNLETTINILQEHGEEAAVWHNVLSTLRKHALAGITDPATMLQAENLFQQAPMLIGELSQRAQAFKRLLLEQQEEILQGFSFSMAPAMSLREIGAAVSQHFPAMGIKRFYMMLYTDTARPQPEALPPTKSYHLLLKYDDNGLQLSKDRLPLATGRLLPDVMPRDRRYTAIVMPLSLAENRFGFIWMEMGTRDWEAYTRVRNLTSSALLRTMLVEQREQAQQEVERLLEEAKQRAEELSIAKDQAEQAAIEKERLYQTEADRREQAERLSRASRNLSALFKVDEVPQQILKQLMQVLPYGRGAVFLQDSISRTINAVAYQGFPDDPRTQDLHVQVTQGGVYDQIAKTGEPLVIADVEKEPGWVQLDWLPMHHSWMGVPLFSKNKVIGILSLTREGIGEFSQDDVPLVSTFAMQAAIALENARLYDEVTRFNELMERMVSQRVEELNNAYTQLEKMDKNKTSFIQVAAHELRTPITVIKGNLGILKSLDAIKSNEMYLQVAEGALKGTDRLLQIVNAMLDVVKLDTQTLQPHFEQIAIGPILSQVQTEYRRDLEERKIALTLDESLRELPPIMADPQLLQKAFDAIVQNAIKFTPDGGSVRIAASTVKDERMGPCVEVRIRDTGIGIDPANHKVIFEKLYQLGKVELHSSGRTKFKGGGPGLGLAIAAGIIRAHKGKVWVESPGYDEEKLPGSTFFVRIPIPQ
ncbi:MAG: substrate-binding domain-containing protein [Anaerolineales bacterium]